MAPWKKVHTVVHVCMMCACVGILPAPSQEQQAQCHVMGHMEAIVHLATGSLVEEATELQDLQVPSAGHHHGHRQQNH